MLIHAYTTEWADLPSKGRGPQPFPSHEACFDMVEIDAMIKHFEELNLSHGIEASSKLGTCITVSILDSSFKYLAEILIEFKFDIDDLSTKKVNTHD